MPYNADAWVFVIVVVIIAVWIGYGISRWLRLPPARLTFLLKTAPPGDSPHVQLLEEHGYEVLSGKVRVPLKVRWDQRVLKSRVYLDFVVRNNADIYVVKIAKSRDQVKWSGSGLRDAFLTLALLHEQITGVLYLDPVQKTVQKIQFEFSE